MRLIDADAMKMRIIESAELAKAITEKKDEIEVTAGMLLSIIETQPTVETKEERLIAKKAKHRVDVGDMLVGDCPACNRHVVVCDLQGECITYCGNCGQSIDWREG